MKFSETKIPGVYIVDIEPKNDERGLFARTFCEKEFAAQGLCTRFVQNSISVNKKKGTLRGMHWQEEPHQEIKIVSCIKGAIFDVALDIRKESPTFKQWISCELTEDNHRMLYIPQGCAHGFQTLLDNSIVSYQISEYYHAECGRGVRGDALAIGIKWPIKEKIISQKDLSYELLS
jgi:dTDP-4-dehydrorhamnose 3,5-epimerase